MDRIGCAIKIARGRGVKLYARDAQQQVQAKRACQKKGENRSCRIHYGSKLKDFGESVKRYFNQCSIKSSQAATAIPLGKCMFSKKWL